MKLSLKGINREEGCLTFARIQRKIAAQKSALQSNPVFLSCLHSGKYQKGEGRCYVRLMQLHLSTI